MSQIIHTRMEDLEPRTRESEKGFGFTKRFAFPPELAKHCEVGFYELPPHKSNYPYHYHLDQEEVFYIISGAGVLKCPEGERAVLAGDLIFCPAGEAGAHRLTNTSDSEALVYLDFDAVGQLDVCVYPDSEKVGVWGPGLSKVFRAETDVDYYDREGE